MNVLHIYSYSDLAPIPLRGCADDVIFCWNRHADGWRAWNVNAFFGLPGWIRRVKWDVILINVTYLSQRWDRTIRDRLIRQGEWFRELNGVKVILPQDEFLN